MANRYLLPVFKKVYDRDFSYSNFDDRLEMQKAVYLLQSMGVPVGDYAFRWYHHGPYSQTLQDDMHYEDGRDCAHLKINAEYARKIDQLRDIIDSPAKEPYPLRKWVECLASLHYLREYVLPHGATQEAVITELEFRKPHLDQHTVNEEAYRKMDALFS